MKRIETSKLILIVSFSLIGVLTLMTIIATFLNYDTSGLTVVSSSAWLEAGAAAAFYYTKAKTENRMKILLSMIKELSENEKFEPDIIVQLFEGVTKGE